MNGKPLSPYTPQNTNRIDKPISRQDIETYRAIVHHVGGLHRLREIIEYITGQKIDMH